MTRSVSKVTPCGKVKSTLLRIQDKSHYSFGRATDSATVSTELGSTLRVRENNVKHRSGKSSLHKLIVPHEEILKAVAQYVPLDDLEEARSVYTEAQRGNKVAEFIVGMALLKAHHKDAAEGWLGLSAEQGFEPAKQHLKKAG